MDTDMLLKKTLDGFLHHDFFAGLQDESSVNMAIAGAIQEHSFNKQCLDYYDSIKFNMVSPPIITHIATKLLIGNGFREENVYQELENGVALYPTAYFYPIHYTQEFELDELYKFCTENTYGIHLWNGSWISEFALLENKEYKKGFRLAFDRIKQTPFLPFKYYKKLGKYLMRWLLVKTTTKN
jgi:hypothetical protein